MREDYVPNEKYRNMFGVERNGYGMERVDLYLAQLEVAFKKIREDNRNLKRELAEQGGAQTQSLGLMPPQDMSAVQAQQEQYIAQLQAQLAEQQAINQHLAAQLSEQQDEAHSHGAAQTEGLMAQITALRAEADMLR